MARLVNRIARSVFNRSSQYVLRDSFDTSSEIPSILNSWRHENVSPELIDIAIKAASLASKRLIRVGDVNDPQFGLFNTFPGEHYRLLSALATVLEAKKIVEVGTYTGMGSLSLLYGNEAASLVTFDIIPWNDPSLSSHLSEADFTSHGGRIRQEIADLAELSSFSRFKSVLGDADLIFLDAPKNNKFEYDFGGHLTSLGPSTKRFLVIDDIRFVNMIDFWRSIDSPKIDLTSFGHFSGTGLVDIRQGFLIKSQPSSSSR